MKTYSDYLSRFYPGVKVQKISIDAGFSCPNRDGSISTGGCIYCRNDSFTPRYCNPADNVAEQLHKGKEFFRRKYPEMKYLAYFQSFTGTYNKSVVELEKLYQEALQDEDILGLVIATRPDCLPENVMNLLGELNCIKPVFIELGAETSHDHTLRLINRNHSWRDVVDTTHSISEKGMHCGIHLIAGLPGETKKDVLNTIDQTLKLPIETIKLHQLQVLKGTLLHEKLIKGEISIPDFTLEEYLDLCREIVKRVPEEIIIERFLSQSPPELVVSPSWGLKNYEFMNLLSRQL